MRLNNKLNQKMFGKKIDVFELNKGVSNREIAIFTFNAMRACLDEKLYEKILYLDAGFSYSGESKIRQFEMPSNLFPLKIRYKIVDYKLNGMSPSFTYYDETFARCLERKGKRNNYAYINAKYSCVFDLSRFCYQAEEETSPIIVAKRKLAKNYLVQKEDVLALIAPLLSSKNV